MNGYTDDRQKKLNTRAGAAICRRNGDRGGFARNRQIRYSPGAVRTDGFGNILQRPLTHKLPCFADPVEWVRGRYDLPIKWKEQPAQASGCAMCPVKLFCEAVALERIDTSPPLLASYRNWDLATMFMPIEQKYKHPSYGDFVDACEACSWADHNNDALEKNGEQRAKTKKQKRKRAAAKKKRQKRLRAVPPDMEQAIKDYRKARWGEMYSQWKKPDAPLWLRNRRLDRWTLIVDAWQARQMLHETGAKGSGSEILEWLRKHDRMPDQPPKSIVKRIQEALKLADRLLENGDWPPFLPPSAPSGSGAGNNMHPSAIVVQIDHGG